MLNCVKISFIFYLCWHLAEWASRDWATVPGWSKESSWDRIEGRLFSVLCLLTQRISRKSMVVCHMCVCHTCIIYCFSLNFHLRSFVTMSKYNNGFFFEGSMKIEHGPSYTVKGVCCCTSHVLLSYNKRRAVWLWHPWDLKTNINRKSHGTLKCSVLVCYKVQYTLNKLMQYLVVLLYSTWENNSS